MLQQLLLKGVMTEGDRDRYFMLELDNRMSCADNYGTS